MRVFSQTSTTGQVLRLALVNALLNLLTLSLWRFWGRTRVRRHLWSRMQAFGDPLEYTGTGKELFFGFLWILLAVFVPIALLYAIIQAVAATQPVLAGGLAAVLQGVVLFLVGAGLYRARRYQLGRTHWRGIRCGQDGKAWVYGLMWLGFMALNVVTFGLTFPLGQASLARYQMNHTRIGSAALACRLAVGPLYKRFVAAWAIGVVVVVVFLLLMVGATAALAGASMHDPVAKGLVGLIFAVPAVLILAVPFAWYQAGYYRALARSTSLTGVSFDFTATTGGTLRLVAGNWLMTALSLGMLRPWAALRILRFAAASIAIEAEPDFAAIRQVEEDAAWSAEGLADAFDGAGAF
jgi:uncharacterized membrane protein YjgN (DUF898 family)